MAYNVKDGVSTHTFDDSVITYPITFPPCEVISRHISLFRLYFDSKRLLKSYIETHHWELISQTLHTFPLFWLCETEYHKDSTANYFLLLIINIK
jgi:hypothetical protein